MGDRWTKLVVSEPVNKVAGFVTTQSKTSDYQQGHKNVSLKVVPNELRKFVGLAWGRMTVVGWGFVQGSNQRGPMWVVKCACGMYTTRCNKFVKRMHARNKLAGMRVKKNRYDMCQRCHDIEDLAESYSMRAGIDIDKSRNIIYTTVGELES